MVTFERDSPNGSWRKRTSITAVVVGRNGLAWGRGSAAMDERAVPTKVEGDNKAPAGVFGLTSVFGYAETARTRMPYIRATPDLVCVDDPQSAHYNELVDTSTVPRPDWHSAEQLRREDIRYKWGIVVDHNARIGRKPVVGSGSCVFLHVWLTPDTPTIGCTAMAERSIVDLIHWLDPKRAPALVQMPESLYRRYQARWNLPALR
jgi:D-alanyl-D-alanine dipeptidase